MNLQTKRKIIELRQNNKPRKADSRYTPKKTPPRDLFWLFGLITMGWVDRVVTAPKELIHFEILHARALKLNGLKRLDGWFEFNNRHLRDRRVARTTITRELNRLKRKGVIEIRSDPGKSLELRIPDKFTTKPTRKVAS